MSATISPTEIHALNKEFIKEALIGLGAPEDVINKVSAAAVVDMQTSHGGGIKIGMMDIYGSRVTWSIT